MAIENNFVIVKAGIFWGDVAAISTSFSLVHGPSEDNADAASTANLQAKPQILAYINDENVAFSAYLATQRTLKRHRAQSSD